MPSEHCHSIISTCMCMCVLSETEKHYEREKGKKSKRQDEISFTYMKTKHI